MGRMTNLMRALKISKTEAYKARVAKRFEVAAVNAGLDANILPKSINPFIPVDKPNPDNNHQYRPRYSPKVRYEPSKTQPPPAVSMQYELKPWKQPPEKPDLPEPTKKKPPAIKAEIGNDQRFGRKEILDALS
ncbi:hypothetical protein BGZ80_010249, partial [Entomortierella chlamydospora]